jgi:hypothetical protein
MVKLNKIEVENLLKGLEYKFKKRDCKMSRSDALNKQLEIRENMKLYIEDSNENETFNISLEDAQLFYKKLEYKFKKSEKNEKLINKLLF